MLAHNVDGLVEHAALDAFPHATRIAIPRIERASGAPEHDLDTGCDLVDDSADSTIDGEELDHCSASLTNFARTLMLNASDLDSTTGYSVGANPSLRSIGVAARLATLFHIASKHTSK
jgi:hypothetical protein